MRAVIENLDGTVTGVERRLDTRDMMQALAAIEHLLLRRKYPAASRLERVVDWGDGTVPSARSAHRESAPDAVAS